MEAQIREAIEAVLHELGIASVDFVVEHPKELAHGDYSSNVAMVAFVPLINSKTPEQSVRHPFFSSLPDGKATPRDLAAFFASKLTGQIEGVEKIEIAGPGFTNFYLARNFFSEEIARARTLSHAWGRNASWAGKKVVVEYTDPNPFKEFHVGHVFTNTVGESIARLFMMNGADTKRVNYQGDVGLHVAHAIWGMQQLGLTAESELTARDLGKAYAKGATAYRESEAAAEEIRRINKHIYERDNHAINALYDAGRTCSLEYFETIYEVLGTKFDDYFFESEAGPLGKEVVLTHPEIFPESDGARVFVGEEYGLHTRVFLNKEGLPTYEAKELALAKLKDERLGGYDHSVVSTAKEITEYFKVLRTAMSKIYPELAAKTEHIGHGMVRLPEGKMSSRTGQVIAGLDFINEIKEAAFAKMQETDADADVRVAEQVAIAAIKYATLKSNIKQDSVFDTAQALSFEGDSGPYLQYTHARIVSVLEKAATVEVYPSTDSAPDSPYEIEQILYRFPEVIEETLADRAPHILCHYLTELAGAFNTFYAQEKIADPSDAHAPYKAAIADATRITLQNGLWTLGIAAPERM